MAWNFVDWKIFNKWQRKAWQDTTIVTSMRTINKRLFLSKFNSLSESRIFIIKSWTDQRFRKRLRFLTFHFSSPASVAFLFYPSIFFLKFLRVFLPFSPFLFSPLSRILLIFFSTSPPFSLTIANHHFPGTRTPHTRARVRYKAAVYRGDRCCILPPLYLVEA